MQAAIIMALTTILTDASLCVKCGDQLVMEYLYAGKEHTAFKPYVRQFRSPKGVNPLRDNVIDHIHHHALMFAVAVEGVDFWAENKNCGKQVTRKIEPVKRAGPVKDGPQDAIQGLRSELEWQAPDGKVLACETRTVEVLGPPKGCSVLVWQTTLAPPPGKESIKVGGAHYFGLGLRFQQSMDKADNFFFADAEPKPTPIRGAEKVTPSKWAAYYGPADGKVVTVAMFDHPSNIRPAQWFTMYEPFSYLSATLNLYREPLTINADKPLTLRYGVAVWDGQVDREQIERVYQGWLKVIDAPK